MKSQAKSNNTSKEEKMGALAGTPEQQELKYPHATTSKKEPPSITYLSMLKEVDKIADPVPFKEIKAFYKMEK